ncbi:terminase large subunit [Vibrio phage 1.123.O._10N.286.48.F3]|nr:terminase large subunit [Vibrio phage 1.123.O._10N.286.48.F3]
MSNLSLEIPEAMHPFLQPAFYKVAYGGRSSGKTQNMMRLILIDMMNGHSVLCAREIQKSIKDSIKKSFDTLIDEMGWRPYFQSTDFEIRCTSGKSKMIFMGLKHNVTNVKGADWVTRAFVEEAENISEESWNTLIPTMRKTGSEIYVCFNPKNYTDPTYQRFIVNPPPEFVTDSHGNKRRYSTIRKVNYNDNPWFTEESRMQMLEMLDDDPEMHKHIWLGEPISNTELSIIKPLWIDAAKNAHLHPEFGHLFAPNGNRYAGFDPCDEGEDFNARAYRDNQTVYQIDEWKDRDAGASGERVYLEAMQDGVTRVSYDNIGVGAAVKSKFRDLEDNLVRDGRHEELINFTEFTASNAPCSPDSEYMPGRKNGDHFLNIKAQGWWMLRDRFHNTYKLIVEGKDVDATKLISIDTDCMDGRKFDKLKGELSSPNREYSNGKIKVESKDSLKKRGIASPNMADALVMAFDPQFDVGYDWSAW